MMRLLWAACLISMPAVMAAAQASSAETPQPEKKVCKADPEDTDSRVRRRVCKTEAEWNGDSPKKTEPREGRQER